MTPPALKSPAGPEASPRSIGTLTYTAMGLAGLFGWLLWGDLVALLKDRSVQTVVQLLLKRFEASDLLAGVLIGSVPAIISLVVVPIVSYRSDRHRGRWGRRIPYLLFFTPIAALSMIGLACSPLLGQWLHGLLGVKSPGVNQLILVFLSVFWITFEFANIVLANSLFVSLINDVVPKAYLGRFFGLFRAVSLIAGMFVSFWLGMVEQYYVWFFVGFGLLYFGGFTIMCLKVKEGEYPPPPPAQPGVAGGFFRAAGQYFRESFSKPYYLWIFATITLAQMALVPGNTYNLFFAKSVGISTDTIGKMFTYSFMISFGLSYPLGWLADRFHPLRLCLTILVVYAAAALWCGLYATNAGLFVYGFMAHQVVSGAWWTAVASLAQRLFPQAKFAQYYSAMGVAGAGFNILLPVALGSFLDLTGHTYRYIYLAAFGLAILALLAGRAVYRGFLRHGGHTAYLAPE